MSRTHRPMERNNTPPTPTSQNEDIWVEIRKLWKRLGRGNEGEIHDVEFSLPGPVYEDTSGGYYLPYPSGTITNVFTSLRVAGTTQTKVEVWRNDEDEPLVTITVPPERKTVRTSLPLSDGLGSFRGDFDELYVKCIEAGEDAVGLTVQCRFRLG